MGRSFVQLINFLVFLVDAQRDFSQAGRLRRSPNGARISTALRADIMQAIRGGCEALCARKPRSKSRPRRDVRPMRPSPRKHARLRKSKPRKRRLEYRRASCSGRRRSIDEAQSPKLRRELAASAGRASDADRSRSLARRDSSTACDRRGRIMRSLHRLNLRRASRSGLGDRRRNRVRDRR